MSNENKNKKKIKLAIFDWAGTTVDYGSLAPITVFRETFESKKIHLSKEEIVKPMGMEKKDHIKVLLQMESVSKQWEKEYERKWEESDVEELYQIFEDKLAKIVGNYSVLIPGVIETMDDLKEMDIRIASDTGYTTDMMKNVVPKVREAGYNPECVITPEIVGSGRPGPFMIYEAMRRLNIYPPKSVIKVGDTVVDILEGVNAGVWSIGVLEGSSEVGLSLDEMKKLSKEEINIHKEKAKEAYLKAGADFVIDNIRDLPEIIKTINMLLVKKGE